LVVLSWIFNMLPSFKFQPWSGVFVVHTLPPRLDATYTHKHHFKLVTIPVQLYYIAVPIITAVKGYLLNLSCFTLWNTGTPWAVVGPRFVLAAFFYQVLDFSVVNDGSIRARVWVEFPSGTFQRCLLHWKIGFDWQSVGLHATSFPASSKSFECDPVVVFAVVIE